MIRALICSQHSHCLSCRLSVAITGKDCRDLTYDEVQRYGGEGMYINGKWYTEPELEAYVNKLKERIRTLEEALERCKEEENE